MDLDSSWYMTTSGLDYLDKKAETSLESTTNAELVLEFLARSGPKSTQELSSYFDVTTEEMKSILTRMQSRGLIEYSAASRVAPYTVKDTGGYLAGSKIC